MGVCKECHHIPSGRHEGVSMCYCRCHDVADLSPALAQFADRSLAYVKHTLEFFGWERFPSLEAEVEKLRDELSNLVAITKGPL